MTTFILYPFVDIWRFLLTSLALIRSGSRFTVTVSSLPMGGDDGIRLIMLWHCRDTRYRVVRRITHDPDVC